MPGLVLDSLLAQDMPDWEGVLVNDGSPDGSRDIAAAYCERTRALRWSIRAGPVERAQCRHRRVRRLLSRSWIPTTALRPMHAA
ncbi:MAG: glycosyltransferase [Collinsella sp.]